MDEQKEQSENGQEKKEQSAEKEGRSSDAMEMSGIVVEHSQQEETRPDDLSAGDLEKELLSKGGVEILKNGETYEKEYGSEEGQDNPAKG